MHPDFKVIIGEVPEPDFLPLGKIHRPGKTIVVIHYQSDPGHLIQSRKKILTLTDWSKWIKAFHDPELNPFLSWENPEKHLPKKYWNLPVTRENIPLELRE